jgi:hypothetical protein
LRKPFRFFPFAQTPLLMGKLEQDKNNKPR